MRRALVCVLMLLGAGCGAVPGQGQGATPSLGPSGAPAAALERWKDFPAGARPRPVVWFGGTGLSLPSNGFPDGDSKMAAACNKLVLAGGLRLPTTGPAMTSARWPAGVTASYAGSISPAEAFDDVMKLAKGGNPSDCARVAPLVITSATVGTAGFFTDRGTAQMTAWIFQVPSVSGVYAYPALPASAFWGGGRLPAGGGGPAGARVSDDGRTLTLGLVGGPDTPGPCGVDYSATVAESDAAVLVEVASRFHTPPAGGGCTDEGHARTVVVHLAAPLGGRVLVDAAGDVEPVCPATGAC